MLALAMFVPFNVLMKCVTGWVTAPEPLYLKKKHSATLLLENVTFPFILIHNGRDVLWNWWSFNFVKYSQLSHPAIYSAGQEWLFYSSRLDVLGVFAVSLSCRTIACHRSVVWSLWRISENWACVRVNIIRWRVWSGGTGETVGRDGWHIWGDQLV